MSTFSERRRSFRHSKPAPSQQIPSILATASAIECIEIVRDRAGLVTEAERCFVRKCFRAPAEVSARELGMLRRIAANAIRACAW